MRAPQVTWPELVVLMAVGDGPDPTLSGVVRTVHVEHVEDVEDRGAADVEVDGVPYRHVESRYRLLRRGPLRRRERLADGRPLAILGADVVWIWEDEGDVPTAYPREQHFVGFTGDVLVERQRTTEHRPGDFTQAGGAPVPVRFLGRDAWQVEVLPPPHKPYPLTLVVDAATGFVLSRRNAGFGSVEEWEELTVGADLPDELFVWDGPAREAPDPEAEHRRDLAERRAWLAERGIRALPLSTSAELLTHEHSADGAFHASFDVRLQGSLQRRPHTDAPWPPEQGWPHVHGWTDGAWDWQLGTTEPVDERTLTVWQAHLRDTR